MEEKEAVSKGCPASTVVGEGQGSVGLNQTLPPVEDALPASQEPWVLCQGLVLGEQAEA